MQPSINGWSAILPGFVLHPGEELRSKSGAYKLLLQNDGNLVLFNESDQPYWTSNTFGHPDLTLTMQSDGNLVLTDSNGIPWWSTYTDANKNDVYAALPHSGAFFVLQDDGNAVLVDTNGTPLWNVWDNMRDRGTNVVDTITKTLKGVAKGAVDVIKVAKVALPIGGAVVALTGVGAPLGAAMVEIGKALGEVQPYVEDLYAVSAIAQQGVSPAGFYAGVAALSAAPDELAAVRASLDTDDDRKAFDVAITNAPQITSDPAALASAQALLRPTVATTTARLHAVSAALNAATAPPPTKVATSVLHAAPSILDTLAKAQNMSTPAYVATQQAQAARVAGRAPAPLAAPKVTSATSSSPSSSAVIVLALAAGLALLASR